MTESSKKRPNVVRQAVTLLLALAIFALAAVVIYPKLQQRTQGPVRLDVVNGTGASLVDLQVSLSVPAGESVGETNSVIESGRLQTIYEGLGPVEIVSVGYVYGADSLFQTHELGYEIEPGGVVVLRITADGVEIDAAEIVDESP